MAPPNPLPALLFVHGAWHSPKTWTSLRLVLEKSGYETHAADLPSVGLRPDPPKDHREDVAAVQDVLEKLVVAEGKNVILVAHSYGGVVGSSAVQGFEPGTGERGEGRKNGVVGVVFVDAILPREGMTMAETVEQAGGGMPMKFIKMVNANYSEVVDPHTAFYADATLEESKFLIDDLRPWARTAARNSKISYEAWKHVPIVYVSCTKSEAMPLETQRSMLREVRKVSKFPVTVHELPASHTPMLKFEKKLAGFIHEMAMEHSNP